MNRLFKAAIPMVATAGLLAGCNVPSEQAHGSGEIITCKGPWITTKLAPKTLVYDIVVAHNGIADEMGVRRSENLGFVAMSIAKVNPYPNILSYPLGCEVRTGQSESAMFDATTKIDINGWYVIDQSQTGADLIITAPSFDPMAKGSN